MPHTVFDLAAHIIEEQHDHGRTVDKLQLQKLLYEVKGVHYALWNEQAFRDSELAYANGPVVRVVEQSYATASAGRDPLPGPVGGHPERVPTNLRETVSVVLARIGHMTGPELEALTKAPGSPWQMTRGPLPSGAPSSAPIPESLIRSWFLKHGLLENESFSVPSDALERIAAGDAAAIAQFTR